jgi:hypothetical protein
MARLPKGTRVMRPTVFALIATAGAFWLAVPAQATPAFSPHNFASTATAPEMVRQRCGAGMKRAKAWQDKAGAWHGACVPKHSGTTTQ